MRKFLILSVSCCTVMLASALYEINNLQGQLVDYEVLKADEQHIQQEYSKLVDRYENLKEAKDFVRLYDIPLSEELQIETYRLCCEYGIEEHFTVVLALMKKESNYNPNSVSVTNDYGICQINKSNHAWLTKQLGVTDFFDPAQNIHCCIYMLSDYIHQYDTIHKALMAYNMGTGNANRLIAQGTTSSSYSRAIMEIKAEL